MPYPDRAWSDIWPGREDRVVYFDAQASWDALALRPADRNPTVRVPFRGIAPPGNDALTRSYWWMDIAFAADALPPGEFGSGYSVNVGGGNADSASSVQELTGGYDIRIQRGISLDDIATALEALAEIDSVTFTPRYAAVAADTGTDTVDPFAATQRVTTTGFSARRQASALLEIPIHNADIPAVVEVVIAESLALRAEGNGWTCLLADNGHDGADGFGSIPGGEARGIALLDRREIYLYYNRTTLGWNAFRTALEGLDEIDAAYLRQRPVGGESLNWNLPGNVVGMRDVPYIEGTFSGGRDYPLSRVEVHAAHRSSGTNVSGVLLARGTAPPAGADRTGTMIIQGHPVRFEFQPDENVYVAARSFPGGSNPSAWPIHARVWDIDSRS